MRRRAAESGQALALVLIALALGTIMISPTLSYVATGLRAQRVTEDYLASQDAADSGVLDAIWKILNEAILEEVNEEGSYAYDFEIGWDRWPVTIEIPSVGGSEWQTIKGNNQCKIDVEPSWLEAEPTEDVIFHYIVRLRLVVWDLTEFCFELPVGLTFVDMSTGTAGPESISSIDPDTEVDAPNYKYWRTKKPNDWVDLTLGTFTEVGERPDPLVPGFRYVVKEWLTPDTAWESMSSGTLQGLDGVWGSSGSDVFAVGGAGTVLHYSNSTWSEQSSGVAEHLRDVWGSSGCDVFAAGDAGTILHYDGSSWSSMSSGTTDNLLGVWGSAASDVFAVGPATILHYDGASWSSVSNITEDLNDVWGSSATDVFAVGDTGAILHYDGSSWDSMTSGTTDNLPGVWGSSATDVFAVGTGGTILHYDGSTWSAMSSGTTENLSGVWGRSSTDVFAVGACGTILHYDDDTWSALTSGTSEDISDVWVGSETDVVAVGSTGTILHYDSVHRLTWLPNFGATGNDTFIMVFQAKGTLSWGIHHIYPVFGDGVEVFPIGPTAAIASAIYNILIDYGDKTISAVIAVTAEGIELISYQVIE
jgi:hypothetical protein